MSSQTRPAGRRAAARVRLGIPATLILLGGTHPCLLDDLSQTGARVSLVHPPLAGASGFLMIQEVEAFGAIMWSIGNRFGMRFDEPLPIAQVVAIRNFADSFADYERDRREREARDFVHARKLIG